MTRVPFPPALAEWSAINVSRAMAARFAEATDTYVISGVAAWRSASGRVFPAADLKDPWYPAGATPGIGDFHSNWRAYANGDGGSLVYVSDFIPADELLRDRPLHDPERRFDPFAALSIAHITTPSGAAFLWAHDEVQMRAWLDVVPADATVLRSVIHRCDPGEPAVVALLAQGGTHQIWVGADLHAISQAPGMVMDIQTVALGTQDFIERANLPATRLLGAAPSRAMLREDHECHIALVDFGAGEIILRASDPDCLNAHIANALLDINAAGRSDHPTVSDADIIAHYWDRDNDLFIWQGKALCRAPYGAEPDRYAVVVNQNTMPPEISGFCACNDQDLADLLRVRFAKFPKPSVPRTLSEVEERISQQPGLSLHLMRADELADRLTYRRQSEAASDYTI